jgi:hypothetical protein
MAFFQEIALGRLNGLVRPFEWPKKGIVKGHTSTIDILNRQLRIRILFYPNRGCQAFF